jgi:hypothetical protein
LRDFFIQAAGFDGKMSSAATFSHFIELREPMGLQKDIP